MRLELRRRDFAGLIFFATLLTAGLGLKLFYSGAPADQPRWLLAPTAVAVELVGGPAFDFAAGEGYVSHEFNGRLVLYRGCSGLNFLAISLWLAGFAPLYARFTRRVANHDSNHRGPGAAPVVRMPLAVYFMIAPVLAVFATVFANVSRIQALLAIAPVVPDVLHPGAGHLAVGAFVYLIFLVLYFLTLRLMIETVEA